MAFKTNKFTDTVLTAFRDHVVDNDVYVFGADIDLSTDSINSKYSQQDVLEKTIFGIKILEDDISYMMNNTVWAPGIVYQMYDDQDELLDANFYVVVEPEEITGDYYVFKCIFNNNGGVSTSKPLYDENILSTGGESNVADGYIWKYMFTAPYSTVSKFKTQGFFPIISEAEVIDAADDGIHSIVVENTTTNFGYEKVEGVIFTQPDGAGRVGLTIANESLFNEASDIYAGKVLYVTKQVGEAIIGSKQYVIARSGRQGIVYYVDILGYSPLDFDGDGISVNDDFTILPQVLIEGTGTGAEAIVVFDGTNTRINSIKVVERGTGYVAATATIVDPVYFGGDDERIGDVRAIVRPIISPEGGHGFNPRRELRSRAACISGVIKSDTTNVPDSNFYSKLALVSNPTFSANTPVSFDNRMILGASANTGTEVGLVISQSNGAEGIIHEVVGNNIYVVNYLGPHNDTFETSLPLSLGSVDINITTVTQSIYDQRSGDVFYVTDFQPVERTADKREVIKIIIDF